jgi:hypothetical protein
MSTPDGKINFVPLENWDRIQVYDSRWKFLRGWHVEGGGKPFSLNSPRNDRVDVMSVLNREYEFDLAGNLVSTKTCTQDEAITFDKAHTGRSVLVPTLLPLWPLTGPFSAWVTLIIGVALYAAAKRTRQIVLPDGRPE